MKKMTEENLKAAFAGESQACVKYTIFAEKAEKEGYPEIAKLFRAIAHAERIHAANHLRVLGGIGSTVENLIEAMGGENFEVNEMYPAYDAVAKVQEEKSALKSINYAMEVEKVHEKLYQAAKEAVDASHDMPAGDMHVCPVCGHTVVGELCEDCPVCGAKKEKYVKF